MSESGDRRLNSWKEIASFFGKDERTVKRWETQRGLPVHRVPGGARSRVFAYPGELDAWLKGAGEAAVDHEPEPASVPSPTPGPPAPPRRQAVAAGGLVLLLVLAAGFAVTQLKVGAPHSQSATATEIAADVHQPPEEAVEHYLVGIFNLEKRTPESLVRAVEEFNQAIARDPQYAEAFVGLANSYNLLREYTPMPASEAYPLAKQAAERALALNDNLAEAHTALAFVEFYWTRDIPRAQRAFDRSLELDPTSVRAHHWYATALLHMGAFDHALEEINAAQKLDPQSRSIRADKGLILFYAGRVEEAVTLLEDLQRTEKDYLSPFAYLAAIFLAERRYPEFFEAAKEAARLIRDDNRRAVIEAAEAGYREGGDAKMFAAMLAEQLRLHAAGKESAWRVAQTYGAMGDSENALRYLRASIDAGEEYPMAIRIEPAFRTLHQLAAFKPMVVEMGMPPL